jgi:hypothetical protein
MNQMTNTEIKELGLTRETAQRFLDTYYAPAMEGYAPEGPPKVKPNIGSGQLTIERSYRSKDGRITTLQLVAGTTQDGARVITVIGTLVLSALAAKGEPGGSLPTGRARYAFWGRKLREVLPVLNATGVKGILRQGTKTGRDELFTFEEFTNHCERVGAGENP